MVPRPEACMVSHWKDRQLGQAGRGGCRKGPPSEHRWMSSFPSLAPSKKKALSWVRDGRGRLGRGAVSAAAAGARSADVAAVGRAAGAGWGAATAGFADAVGAAGRGRNFRMRKRMVASGAPVASV